MYARARVCVCVHLPQTFLWQRVSVSLRTVEIKQRHYLPLVQGVIKLSATDSGHKEAQ